MTPPDLATLKRQAKEWREEVELWGGGISNAEAKVWLEYTDWLIEQAEELASLRKHPDATLQVLQQQLDRSIRAEDHDAALDALAELTRLKREQTAADLDATDHPGGSRP